MKGKDTFLGISYVCEFELHEGTCVFVIDYTSDLHEGTSHP